MLQPRGGSLLSALCVAFRDEDVNIHVQLLIVIFFLGGEGKVFDLFLG